MLLTQTVEGEAVEVVRGRLMRKDARDPEALPLRTQARVLGATLKGGETTDYELGTGRFGYLVPAKGSVEVNGVRLDAGDGAAIREEPTLRIRALEDSELVLVDTTA